MREKQPRANHPRYSPQTCAASIAGVPDKTLGTPMAMIASVLALTAAAAASPRLIGGWRQAEVAAGRPSIVNCTWQNFTQKIDHFGDAPGTFPQRLCLYDKWWRPGGGAGGRFRAAADAPGPILFYTGNESPVDEYVNNTGLMWEIGERLGVLLLLAPTRAPNPEPDHTRPLTRTLTRALTPTLTPNNPPTDQGALLVFAEHRYEPLSHPALCGPNSQRCLAYCTTAQAIADWVTIIAALRARHSVRAPVVAFGGSCERPPFRTQGGGGQHETHTHTQQDTQIPLSIPHAALSVRPCPAIYPPRRRHARGLVPYEVPRGSRRCHRRLRAHLAGMAYLLY